MGAKVSNAINPHKGHPERLKDYLFLVNSKQLGNLNLEIKFLCHLGFRNCENGNCFFVVVQYIPSTNGNVFHGGSFPSVANAVS